MKKFKLYATVFAALCFAASCQDDVIDSGQGQGNGGDGTPAYLTLSFTANSGSSTRSTADDANNQGDTDGDQEDSGHQNSGTSDEQAVDKVLVVITPANGGNVNFAKLYNTSTSTQQRSSGKFEVTNSATGAQYTNDTPIELTTGQYNVLVVANPVDDLITNITSTEDLNAGISNSNVAENLYTRITTGNYLPEETEWSNIASGTAETGQSFRIMMANKALSTTTGQNYTVELTAEHTVDKPAEATIEIERAYSKITFRETKYNNTTANVYEVPLYIGQVKAILVDAAIDESDLTEKTISQQNDPPTYVYKQLNAAWDAQTPTPNEVYVLWETELEGGTPVCKGVFRATTEIQEVDVPKEGGNGGTTKKSCTVYKKLTPVQKSDPQTEFDPETQYVVDYTGESSDAAQHPTDGLVYRSEETGQVENWYIRLKGYALVNLSKNVHYVRHTTDALGQSAFGTLNGANYLYTPYWNEKNDDSNFTTDATTGNITFIKEDDSPISEKWFYNTLAEVSKESEVLTITDRTSGSENTFSRSDKADVKFFKPMPTGNDQGSVTGEGSQHSSTLPNVGKFMSYCFENSTDIDHQLHGLSTGITFVARIYANADCSETIKTLYRYDNHLFESLEAIQKSYGANLMSNKFNELVAKEIKGETITKADMKALAEYKATDEGAKNGEKIDLYADGICYYYTTEIKHFDNGSNTTLGNMEFAIMRNNIYSLAVTSINDIGDPFVDPTPNTPNENTDPITALNVNVEIIPWIVRYNDIEF